jgi:hypothetical protein
MPRNRAGYLRSLTCSLLGDNMAALEQMMQDLYAEEINCGISSFWDGGFTAWIGDEMNGRKAERNFDAEELDRIAGWFLAEARRLYSNFQTMHEKIEAKGIEEFNNR